MLEEGTADGHHRARIGVDEWMSLRTEKGSVLATPQTVLVASESVLVPVVPVANPMSKDGMGED